MSKCYDYAHADNKNDARNGWVILYNLVYDHDIGIARDFNTPSSKAKVSDFKKKVMNQLFPAAEKHITAKRAQHLSLTETEESLECSMEKFKKTLKELEDAKKEQDAVQAAMESAEATILPGAAPAGSAITSSLQVESIPLIAMQPATSIPPPGGPPLGYDPNYDPLADLTNTMKPMLEQMKRAMELSLQGMRDTPVATSVPKPAPHAAAAGSDSNLLHHQQVADEIHYLEEHQQAALKAGDHERVKKFKVRIQTLDDKMDKLMHGSDGLPKK